MCAVNETMRAVMIIKGTNFVHDANQSNTDLDKTVLHLVQYHHQHQQHYHQQHTQEKNAPPTIDETIVTPTWIMGGLGGNLSQQLANINALYQFEPMQLNGVLLSDENICCVLPPGQHRIHVSAGLFCGLFPMAGLVHASTTGLQWNLGTGLTLIDRSYPYSHTTRAS